MTGRAPGSGGPGAVVIAPDSFKGSLDAAAAAQAMAEGWREVAPAAELRLVPMADGGEGTAAAMVAATDGSWVEVDTTDPLGREITASYGRLGGEARRVVVEVAAASGLDLVADDERDVWRADSAGTGVLLRHALDAGAEEIVLGLGGSATVDGGAGIGRALGLALLDADGSEVAPGAAGLSEIRTVRADHLHPRLADVRIRVASDVTNPLAGESGAAAVFGPQKGAGPDDVDRLDGALVHWADRLAAAGLGGDRGEPGMGAAGGIGFLARYVLGGELASGVDLVADGAGLADACAGAGLVLTGEGRLDGQTASGKVPLGVARIAAAAGVPTVALVGSLGEGHERVLDTLLAVVPVGSGPQTLDRALASARDDLRRTARTVAALMSLDG